MAETASDLSSNDKKCGVLIVVDTDFQFAGRDGFMGTGSTALAAIQTQRAYLGAEIDKAYFEIAQNRIKEVEKRNVTNYF